MSRVPDTEELWARLRRFMARWGTVDDTARGLSLTWGEQHWVTEVEITQDELYAYVHEYVNWRIEHGLDTGLENGVDDDRENRLPMPLMDSFGDCFGPQDQAYLRIRLQGLDFVVVPDATP
ncbi:hypothetical protein UG56_004430 [Nocardioides luteus]|uniref:Uncharacterized protein n=1 Tax=Nocardioides luteus TaxID=1844 RepID=A0A1J4NAJ4_9ACTN|nr:hypothetical protein UG56_004430 [Nocardioides luteus]